MARIRSIKPDFWTDEKIVELSPFARLLFIGLWNFADDDGRMEYSEKKIKMQVLPSDALDISELFGEIRREKLVEVYTVDNKEYLQILNFAKHQKVDRRTTSKLPSPPEFPRVPPTEGKGIGREKEEEGKKEKPSSLRSEVKKNDPGENPPSARKQKPALPDWLPAEPWQAYVEMRQKLRRPMTARAAELAISKLTDLRAKGHDPTAVLEQSVLNSWQGLFALKDWEIKEKRSVRKVI